jgi:hypothetical protein
MLKNGSRSLIGAGVSVILCTASWAQAPAKSDAPAAKPDVAAHIGSQPITIQELDAKIFKTNMTLAQQLYEARKAAVDEIVVEKALAPEAATRGISVDELLKERALAKAAPVTDAEIETFYNNNKNRMGGKTLEQMSGQLRTHLAGQRETEARNNLIREFRSKSDVRVTLDPPRVDVTLAANDPMKGPANAKVTIVEFSDFQ